MSFVADGVAFRGTTADAEYMDRLSDEIEGAAENKNAKAYFRSNEKAAAWHLSKITDSRISSLALCAQWYNVADTVLPWGNYSEAIRALTEARRACGRLGKQVPSSLPIAIDGLEGRVLQHLSRNEDAVPYLERAFDGLKAAKFSDVGQVETITRHLAEALNTQGKPDVARDRLMEAWRSLEQRPFFWSSKVGLLLALSTNAEWRGFYHDADRWAQSADEMMSAQSETHDQYFVSVRQQHARTTRLLVGAGASLKLYRDAVARLEVRNANSEYLMIGLYEAALAQIWANNKEQASISFDRAEKVGHGLTLTHYYRSAMVSYEQRYYSWTSNCQKWPGSAAEDLALATKYKLPKTSYERTLAIALAMCGQAKQAFEVAARDRSQPSAKEPWGGYQRQDTLAKIHYFAGDPAEAARLQTELCARHRDGAASSARGADAKLGPADILTMGAATCYQVLAGYLALAEEKAPTTPPGVTTLTGRNLEAFEAAQWSQQVATDDGVSLSLAIAAADKAGPDAGARARRFEEADRSVADMRRTIDQGSDQGEVAQPASADADLAARIVQRDKARADLTAAFRGYWEERSPHPIALAALTGSADRAALLKDDEAVLLAIPGQWENAPMLVFAISRTRSAMMSVKVPRSRLSTLVNDLREQIQPSLSELDGADTGASKLRPFDRRPAQELYQILLGRPEIQAVVGPAKIILYVPSDMLKQVPLSALVTRISGDPVARNQADLLATDWLIKDKAVSTYPSLSALARLRAPGGAVRRSADVQMIAFTDPDFGTLPAQESATAPGIATGADRAMRGAKRTARSVTTGFPELKDLSPAGQNEMAGIAAALRVADPKVLAHADASEAVLKRLNTSGELARYSLLGFATHGMLPDETRRGEAALALSDPKEVGGGEDGLLTASEIARLNLDADLVILSACNTGSEGAGQSAIALARAFLQAKARSLLVTQWYVDNDVGPALLPVMFDWLRTHPADSSARALQQAQLALMKNAKILGAHPEQWAAYTLVGDARVN